MHMAGDGLELASPTEVARALGGLSAADLRRLELIARGRAGGLATIEWRDLLQESVARALEGSRRWPRAVPIVAFLAQTMRSIAGELRSRAPTTTLDKSIIEGLPGGDPCAALEAADLFRRIRQHFKADKSATALMDSLIAGETARETQERAGLSFAEYDAARKRFWRGVAGLNGDVT